jgi:hypothetical protein
VSTGLAKTIDVLAASRWPAATAVLIHALDSTQPSIRSRALAALVTRPGTSHWVEIVRRLHRLDAASQDILRQRRAETAAALAAGVASRDFGMCRNALDAIASWQRLDLARELARICGRADHPHASWIAATLLEIVSLWRSTARAPGEIAGSAGPDAMRELLRTLEPSIRAFGAHLPRPIVPAFLMLCDRDNATLRHVLANPLHAAHAAIGECLSGDRHSAIAQLVASFVADPRAPAAATAALKKRHDQPFMEALAAWARRGLAPAEKHLLKRIDDWAWLRDDSTAFAAADGDTQRRLVELAAASGADRHDVLCFVARVLREGHAVARRAAAATLAAFDGALAAVLAARAMQDPDANVQAAVVSQLRRRSLSGATGMLIDLVDSPQNDVAQAARQELSEFSLCRYLATFDHFDDDARRSTARLVRKIDVDCNTFLAAELRSSSPRRRWRALRVADLLGLLAQLEREILPLIGDADGDVRAEAARCLAACKPTITSVANGRSDVQAAAPATSPDAARLRT